MKIYSKEVSYYNKLGYNVKYGDEINVKVKDLPKKSNKKITAICDICGKEKVIKYETYNENIEKYSFYTCHDCSIIKNIITNNKKYGCDFPIQNNEIKKKVEETCFNKYGVKNISQTKYFKDKYKEIMINTYGVENYFMTDDFQEKRKETCLQKYGVEHHYKNEEFKKEHLIGEKNKAYIDGRSYDEKRRDGHSQVYREWRKQVFDKYNYTCFKCGDNKGGNLNAHHKNSVNKFKELTYDVDNGVCLCEKCHKDFHMKYGFGNNTKEQFYEWLNDD